jgi:hypothetical protein
MDSVSKIGNRMPLKDVRFSKLSDIFPAEANSFSLALAKFMNRICDQFDLSLSYSRCRREERLFRESPLEKQQKSSLRGPSVSFFEINNGMQSY